MKDGRIRTLARWTLALFMTAASGLSSAAEPAGQPAG